MGILILESSQALENVHGSDLSDRHFADPRKYVSLQAAENSIAMRWHPIGRECRVPLSSNHLKRFILYPELPLGQPTLGARVSTCRELSSQFHTALPCRFQRNGGKGPHREALLSSAEAILDAPPFAAARRDLQVQAMAIEQFVDLFVGLSVE